MHRIARILSVVAVAFAGALASGCASTPEEKPPARDASAAGAQGAAPGAPGATGEPGAGGEKGTGAGTGSPEDEPTRRREEQSGLSRTGDYVMTVPENLVWVPWKMIGSGIKGASDGVQGGFDKGRLPFFGVLFSPVNLVVGFGTGFVEGLLMAPGLIGPDDDFSRAMSLPTKRETEIWWYP